MGHVISNDGLKPDPDKVKTVENMSKPTCKKETPSRLGFINYLAKFLPRLSEVAQPLRDLTLSNAQFIWSEQHKKAFDKLKKLVANYPVLKYYDINDEVTIQCDASRRDLGATLLQNRQPVAFASQYITRREKVIVESATAVNIREIASVCAKPSLKNDASTTEIQPSRSL